MLCYRHIVDANSFPLKLKGFSELAEKGSYCPQCIYTDADVRNVVEYARRRGIRVQPEIDVPGREYCSVSLDDHVFHVASLFLCGAGAWPFAVIPGQTLGGNTGGQTLSHVRLWSRSAAALERWT